jgi:energy-coupling factor transport system permease protein
MSSFFLYRDRDTWLHRLDPRTKILAVTGLFAIALLFSDPRYLAAATAGALLLAAAAGALPALRRTAPLLVFLFLYCLLLWPFFVAGRTPWFTVGGHPLTVEAVQFGLGMGLRLDAMLIGGLILLSTTTIEAFSLGLQRMGLPAVAGFALSLAFRWVPSLIGSAATIVQAQRARGLDLAAGGPLARIGRYAPLIVPLVGHTLRQTRLLAMALESKGFGPGLRRQPFLELRLRAPDYLALALTAGLVLASLWLRARGHGILEAGF